MKKRLLPRIYEIVGYSSVLGEAKEFLSSLADYQRTGSLDKLAALKKDKVEMAELEKLLYELDSHTPYCGQTKKVSS